LVAVIAGFAVRGLHHSVAAAGSLLAGGAWCRADIAAFKLTRAAATVATLRIAIVTVLARFNAFVPALRRQDAGLPSDALVARVLYGAGCIAAIVVDGIAVIAHFTRANITVAAYDLARAFASLRASPILFDFANAIAAIAWQHIAVVAFFNTILIVDSVATPLGDLPLATRGSVGAVANSRGASPAAAGGFGRSVDDHACTAIAATTSISWSAGSRATCATARPLDGAVGASDCRHGQDNCDSCNRCETLSGDLARNLSSRPWESGEICFHRRTPRSGGGT
jgi:hypothetical protein